MKSAFVWADGVHVAGTRIWCDAPRAQAVSFLSHAGMAQPAHRRSARVLCSERTLKLLAAVGRAPPDETLVAPTGRPFALGRARLELLPSGRLPGATQLLVQLDGRTVLYAGEVAPRGGRLAEPLQLRGCDALAVAAPLDRALPERAVAEARLVAAVRAALDDGATPVVLAPALGLAEEVAALLDEAGVPVRVHARVAAWLAAYRRAGVAAPAPRRLRGAPARPLEPGVAIVWPLEAAAELRLASARIVPADELSARADLPSLVELAVATGARDVFVSGGLSDETARALGRRRLRAHALGPPLQMGLFG
jgi:hypothetical protein